MGNNAIKRIADLIQEAQDISEKELGINNIFYNESYIDMIIADILGHDYNSETQGGDAFDLEGNWIEYKTINANSKGTGSFQFHWLSHEKIEKYRKSKFFFIVRQGARILRIYHIDNKILIPILEEKYKEGEERRKTLGKEKSIDAHKSFSEKKLLELGGELIYGE